jgi:hypothetical protein
MVDESTPHHFSYESFLRCFYVLTIWVCNFLAKGFLRKSSKALHKMLVKLAAHFPIETLVIDSLLP